MNDDPSRAVNAENRRLAAIMFTDMVGFSRQMGADEAHTLRLLAIHNQVIEHAVAAHQGHVIKTAGDGFLIEFPSVVHAVQCAQGIQAHFHAYNAEQAKADQIHVRIGLHEGDILVQPNGDVLGDGVNIASRLQTLAEPDTICISQKVYEEVEKKLPLGTVVSLGRPQLKNIAQRFQVYLLLSEQPKGLRQALQVQRLKLSRRVGTAHRVALVGVALLVGVIVTVQYFSPSLLGTWNSELGTPTALPLPDKPSIVVLPFDNMSGDPQQDYFSNGITEVLTSDLSRIASLFIIARNTAFTYKGKAINVQEVGKELGVRYVVEGSVQKAADHVRIVAQLINATTGHHLWSERYDRPLTDIFALQDEIVQKIVTTLKLQLTVQEQGYIVRKHTDNMEAYDAFLRGVESFGRYSKETTAQARHLFEKALALDPQYAEAYVWLGRTYTMEWGSRFSTDPQILERAFELEQKAVALDASLPLAHSVLSFVYAQKQQYDQALTEGEQAISLDANNADSYAWQASVMNFAGRPEEAIKMVKEAMRRNPRHPPFDLFTLGAAYYLTGRYAKAVATLKELLSRSPNHPGSYFNLALNYVSQWTSQQNPDAQTLEQALAAAQRAIAISDSSPLGHWSLGLVYLWQKQYEPALAEMKRAIDLDPNGAMLSAALAEVLSRMGRSEEALLMVKQALHRKTVIVDFHLANVGTAYDVAGRPEEAVAPLKQFLTRYPNILGAHLTLAAVYSELGREAEARAEAAEVLRLNPNFSLEVHKERVPIKEPAMLERHIAALRKAGLK
jgi:TolB-like protein/class 3 adenylate cyclase/cytochrome c-type biogenesis protein CcmH/NrfG